MKGMIRQMVTRAAESVLYDVEDSVIDDNSKLSVKRMIPESKSNNVEGKVSERACLSSQSGI